MHIHHLLRVVDRIQDQLLRDIAAPHWNWNALTSWTAVYALAAGVTFVVLLVAAIMALRQFNVAVQTRQDMAQAGLEAVKTRHAALMSDLSKRWDEDPVLASRKMVSGMGKGPDLRLWIEYLADRNDPRLLDLQIVPNYFEDLAVLLEIGAIPFEMLEKSLGGTIVETWERWKDSAEFLREQGGYDPVYENFRRLAERIRAALDKQGQGPPDPN
jgi:hypothetical protein